MNWLRHNLMMNSTALVAAVMLAIAPVDLLAVCGCTGCGCAAAADDAPGCCCTGNSHSQARSCCGQAQSANDCCRPAATATSDRCSCSKSVPAFPVGTLPAPGHDDLQPQAALLMAAAPAVDAASAFALPSAPDQTLWPVPARVLFCVWRN